MQKINGNELIYELNTDDLRTKCGGIISFCACIHKIRNAGKFLFVELRTGRYIVQSTYSSKTCHGNSNDLCEGAYVRINGIVKEEARAPYGYEIELSDFEILSLPYSNSPIDISDKHLNCTIENNMEYRNIALRHPDTRAVFKISEGIVCGFREFMLKERFTEIHTPKITRLAPDCGINTFKLKYFANDAALVHSPQLYKQSCTAFFDRVFEIAPVYRAEKRSSTRHLNEYTGLDFEMAFIRDISDIMQTETALLKHITEYLKKNYAEEIKLLEADIPTIESIPSVTFFEALDILGKKHSQSNLDPTDEAKLCKYAKEAFNCEFIFVTHLPSEKRPFYTMDSKNTPGLSESFVLLFRGFEITSGAQHIHEYESQIKKLENLNISPENLGEYLDIHKYGMPPHGGLRIGLERFVTKLLKLENIRQASLFPRDLHCLDS